MSLLTSLDKIVNVVVAFQPHSSSIASTTFFDVTISFLFHINFITFSSACGIFCMFYIPYVTIDELLCDAILNSKVIFENELNEILKDCNDYETRFIVDIVKSSNKSMRDLKMFQNKIENKY